MFCSLPFPPTGWPHEILIYVILSDILVTIIGSTWNSGDYFVFCDEYSKKTSKPVYYINQLDKVNLAKAYFMRQKQFICNFNLIAHYSEWNHVTSTT